MTTSLSPDQTGPLAERLRAANARYAARYPGDRPDRQPVHTVYGGAHLFTADTAPKLGQLARRFFDKYAPDAASLAAAVGLHPAGAAEVRERVAHKLDTEPVEDFRVDFEDGYGNRPDAEEDGHAAQVAAELAGGMAQGTLPPFVGIRIKPLGEEARERSFRTLDVLLSALVGATGGSLPDNFVVTLPKVTDPEQAAVLADLLGLLEQRLGLVEGAIPFEVMIELTQSIVGEQGAVAIRRIVDAGSGRVTAAHFGTYDYTASCNITAAHQTMDHPACDFARHMMQVALGGTGVWLSDGATNIMPVPVHRGDDLTVEQQAGNVAAVHGAWKLHYDHIQHSLRHGFYQGWDLHPGQLPTRYAAVYAFFLESLDAAGERLANFVGKAAQATLVGEVFDDAATGQGLLNYFLRAVNSGAITEEEAAERSGLSLDELHTRSFLAILEGRRAS